MRRAETESRKHPKRERELRVSGPSSTLAPSEEGHGGLTDLSLAVDAELALLEGDSSPAAILSGDVSAVLAPGEAKTEEADPYAVWPLKRLLEGSFEWGPKEWASAADSGDGPLVVPWETDHGDRYRFELSNFLKLFAQQYGLSVGVRNGDVVLRVSPMDRSMPVEIVLPLSEEGQLHACLNRRPNVVDPGSLVAHCLARGRHAALKAAARVPLSKARELLGATDLEVVHRQYVQFNYSVILRYYRKEERILSLVYSVEEGRPAPALSSLFQPMFWTTPEVSSVWPIQGSSASIDRLHRLARAEVERFLVERRSVIQGEIDRETKEAIQILDDYYEEKARELEDEKRAVYFHLYYFEKEEAIDKQLAGIRREKEERSRALAGFWDVESTTRLVSLGYFEVPFYKAVGDDTKPWLDGLAGQILWEEAGYRPVQS
jgi:hypothetical protein